MAEFRKLLADPEPGLPGPDPWACHIDHSGTVSMEGTGRGPFIGVLHFQHPALFCTLSQQLLNALTERQDSGTF